MTVWNKFGVRSWPTIVLIDPEGYYCGNLAGEGNREPFDTAIKKLVAYHRAKGTLDETPVRFDLEREKSAPTPLKFPGKVLADELGRRLFIADSNHNRIVVSSFEGKLLETIGSAAIGKVDGAYDKASFDHPQGLALAGQKLYVADTENHLIREVDLIERIVRTVAGTGQQGHTLRGGDALKTPLNSPWDLVWLQGKLFIAMAGQHQLWEFDPRQETVAPHAGSGREDILNGPLDRAAMAQPSGIATDGKDLFVVDSEGWRCGGSPLTPQAASKRSPGLPICRGARACLLSAIGRGSAPRPASSIRWGSPGPAVRCTSPTRTTIGSSRSIRRRARCEICWGTGNQAAGTRRRDSASQADSRSPAMNCSLPIPTIT